MNCIALVVVAFIAFASADYHGMNDQHDSCMSENEKIYQLEMQIKHLTQNNQVSSCNSSKGRLSYAVFHLNIALYLESKFRNRNLLKDLTDKDINIGAQ